MAGSTYLNSYLNKYYIFRYLSSAFNDLLKGKRIWDVEGTIIFSGGKYTRPPDFYTHLRLPCGLLVYRICAYKAYELSD